MKCTFVRGMRNAYKTLVEHLVESCYLRDLGAGNIKEIRCQIVDWILLAKGQLM
jgi:hypothetical protein